MDMAYNGYSKTKEANFKNGRGKFVMVDFDHGTCREWGDRIVFIWEC